MTTPLASPPRPGHSLRAILDHVTFGVLVVDRTQTVQPGSTRSCRDLFGTDRIEGATLADLLRVGDRGRAVLQTALDQVYEDVFPEALPLAQLPSRYRVADRTLQLDHRCIRDAGGAVAGVLVTISDVSALDAVERECRTYQVLVSVLRQRGSFVGFVAEARAQLEAARRAVRDQRFVRRTVHTVQSHAAAFGLDELAAVAHEVAAHPITCAGIDHVEHALVSFLERNRSVLQIDYLAGAPTPFAVDRARAAQLRELVQDCAANAPALARWAAELALEPAHQILVPLGPLVTRLSERIGRPVQLEISGADTPVDAATMRPVLSTIPHCIRNAVDHGVEPAEERGDKAPRATVSLVIQDLGPAWRVLVVDDGRGIDVDRLAERAVAMGHLAAPRASAMTRDEKLGLVFVDGLSGASEATDLSGRGVGMGAVRDAVVATGGRIEVTSTAGHSTTISLTVPKPPGLVPGPRRDGNQPPPPETSRPTRE